MQLRSPRRVGYLAAAGALMGALMLSPVAAHVGDQIGHLWGDHIKDKTDARYVHQSDSDWAVVKSNGDLAVSSAGVTGSNLDQPGYYYVDFKRAIRKCALTATSRSGTVVVSASPEEGETNRVMVRQLLVNGAPGTASFSLIARC